MKVFSVNIHIGVDDDISAEEIDRKIKAAMDLDFREVRMMRIDKIKENKIASGSFRLSLTEEQRIAPQIKRVASK